MLEVISNDMLLSTTIFVPSCQFSEAKEGKPSLDLKVTNVENSTISGEVDVSKSMPLSRLRGGHSNVEINFSVANGSGDSIVSSTSLSK